MSWRSFKSRKKEGLQRMFFCYLQFCVFFLYFKFSLTNFFFYQEALENLRKFHRWKHNKSCLKDPYFLCRRTLRNGIELRHNLYLSIRKLSIPSPFSNLPHGVFCLIDLFFFRRIRPMNITGAVAENYSFHHIKAVLG